MWWWLLSLWVVEKGAVGVGFAAELDATRFVS